MSKRDWTISSNINNYSTLNNEHKWKDLYIELRNQQTCTFGELVRNLGNPLGFFKILHKCSHGTGWISFDFKIGHQQQELMARTFNLSEGGGRDSYPYVGIISFLNPINEGPRLENFIQAFWEGGGGDFIQHDVFEALPKETREHNMGQHWRL